MVHWCDDVKEREVSSFKYSVLSDEDEQAPSIGRATRPAAPNYRRRRLGGQDARGPFENTGGPPNTVSFD
jgi:hypothetical protein